MPGHGAHVVEMVHDLVAHAPADDGRVVVVALDHLGEPCAGRRVVGREVGVVRAPDRDLGHDQQAAFVEVVEEVGRLRVVHEAGENRARALHEVHVLAHQPVGFGVARARAVAHAIEAAAADAFAIEIKSVGAQLGATHAEAIAAGIMDAVALAQRGLDGVEVGMVEVPGRGAGGRQRGLKDALRGASGGHGKRGLGQAERGDGRGLCGAGDAERADGGGENDGAIAGGGVGHTHAEAQAGAAACGGLGVHVLDDDAQIGVGAQGDFSADAAPRPPGAASESVVGSHNDHVGCVSSDEPGDIELERRVAAAVAAEDLAVKRHLRVVVDSFEAQAQARVRGPGGGHGEFAPIPTGAAVVGVGGLGVPVARHV